MNRTKTIVAPVLACAVLLAVGGAGCGGESPAAEADATSTTSEALSPGGWYKICHLPASANGHIFLLSEAYDGCRNGVCSWPVGDEHTGQWEYVHRLYSTWARVGDNYGHTGWISIGYLCDL